MARLNLAVLKAHRLKDTSTFGKQNIYLRITAGSVVKTSNTHQDAGTDCALGEIFSLELPPGTSNIQIEVIAKHSLTGDESIGTASLAYDLVRDSDGEVLRVPVMSKKGRMHGELECTASISETQSSAPQMPTPAANQQSVSQIKQQQQQQYPYPYTQQQQQPGPYPTPYGQQQQPSPYATPAGAGYQPAPGIPYSPYPQQQQQQFYPPGPTPPYPQAVPPYPPANDHRHAAAAVTPYPPPAGYPTPQQAVAAAPMQQQQQPFGSGAGRGRGGMMGTALAAGAGALGGAVVGGAISNAMFSPHAGGWGPGGGWGSGPGNYGGGDTVIVNNYGGSDNQVADYQVDDPSVVDDGGWVDMDDGGGGDFGGDMF